MLAAAAVLLACPLPQEKPPNLRETKKLVAEYFALDPLQQAEHARRMEIVARLDAFPLDSSSKRKRWRKDLLKAAGKRPELPKDQGEHWAWEEQRRGRYFLGGEMKKPNALLISMHGGGGGGGAPPPPARAASTAAPPASWAGWRSSRKPWRPPSAAGPTLAPRSGCCR